MTIWLALFLLMSFFGAAEAETTCKIKTVKSYPDGLICNERGHVRGHDVKNTNRWFYAAHATGCAQECLQDVSCFSFRYEAESSTCTTFFTRIRDNGFRKDPKSPFLYSNYACYKRTGVCNLRNTDFSHFDTDGGDVKPGPIQYSPPKQQVGLVPWSYISGGTGFARVVTPSVDSRVLPQPPGDSPSYALMNISGTEPLSLVQFIRLNTFSGNPSYRFEFNFNVIRAEFSDNVYPSPVQYLIKVAYGSNRTSSTSFHLTSDPRAFGIWFNFVGQFATTSGFSEETFSLSIVSQEDPGNPKVSSTLFGIADIVFEPDI